MGMNAARGERMRLLCSEWRYDASGNICRMQTVLWMSRIAYLPGSDSNGRSFRRNKIEGDVRKCMFCTSLFKAAS